ncbi:MAG: hypothetical protein KAS97_13905, partial [Candidatus Aminicenantes bacterium]|nr:hypothetical protein [Candidatus Aminicenantes bacterium]
IILSDLQGKIHSILLENKESSILLNTENRLRKRIFFQNGIIVLNTLNNKNQVLFDLKTNSIIYESKKTSGKRIIGVDKAHLVYLNKRSINILNFQKDRVIFSTEINQGKITNCEISDNKAFILSENSLLIYDFVKNISTLKSIETPPSSPFLKIDDNIFYGDRERNLVNFSLNKNKIIWKYKFQKLLIIKPVFYAGILIVNPEDNNTYFITLRGGIKQWYRSDYSHQFSPVLMKDHLAVFQRIEEGTLINYYGIKKHSKSSFKDKSLVLKLPPVYSNGNLYSIGSRKDDPDLKLIKIGNKFGSEIKAEPEGNFETGKSIKFLIRPVNITKPEITAEIFNEKNDRIFSKKFQYTRLSSFTWVPDIGGKFILNVITKDEKGVIRTDTKDLIVIDTGQMYKKLQMKLHRKCEAKEQITNRKNEKTDKKLPD